MGENSTVVLSAPIAVPEYSELKERHDMKLYPFARTIMVGLSEPHRNQMTLRTRLMLVVLLATLLPAGLIGLRFIQERAENVAVAMRNLEGVADSVAVRITSNIQGTTQLHYGLARAKELDTNHRAACSSFLSGVRQAYPQYTGILTIKPDGQLFCDSLNTGRTLDLHDRNYFKRALVATDVTLEPVFGKLTGKAVLQIAYPARTESGLLKFVLLASLDLEDLVQKYMSELPQTTYEIALTDSNGMVLVGSPPERWKDHIGKSIFDTEIFQSSNARPGGGIDEVSGFDGSQQVWAFAEIPEVAEVGLHVMVGMPRNDLVVGPNNRFLQNLTILFVFFMVVFAGVWSLADFGLRKPAENTARTR